MTTVASPELLASTRILDLLAVDAPSVTPRQNRSPLTFDTAAKPTTKRIKRRPTRALAAALEAAMLDRINIGQTPVSTGQMIAAMQGQFSGLKSKTVENKLRDLHKRGKVRKHPSLRATWMRQTQAVPPTIVRRAERPAPTPPSEDN